MKKTQLLAVTVLTASLVGLTFYLLRKDKHKRRMTVISDAGYETAYDIHYPHQIPPRQIGGNLTFRYSI